VSSDAPRQVLIAGGGIAGLEAALALADLAGDRVRATLIDPEGEFELKPLAVEEPFTHQPAVRHELAPALAEIGVGFLLAALAEVDPAAHTITDGAGEVHPYDVLVVALGGRARPAFVGVETFWSDSSVDVDELIARAAGSDSRRLTLVVPPRTTWPLPLYELALQIRRRSEDGGHGDLGLRLMTPEDAPLGVFGSVASAALAELLEARRIELQLATYVTQPEPGGPLCASPGDEEIDPALVLALPEVHGARVDGLPADDDGFIPVDEHGRVKGVENVYAAGDGTNFPIKQGGLATQQADAVAEHIAMRAGAIREAKPFKPVLRGQLLTGMESLHMKHGLAGGEGEGEASLDYLWWPPQKVAGRYLAPWLGHGEPGDLDLAARPIEVDVSWPQEWHETPLTSDPD
jgi:sulfide:quinone oxidoreductase